MLTGKELGRAIKDAVDKKIAAGAISCRADVASHFGIKPPSIYDWFKKGSISKDKLPELFRYFSDVVGQDHWGMADGDWPSPIKAGQENIKKFNPQTKDKITEEVLSIMSNMSPAGKAALRERALVLVLEFPKINQAASSL